MAFDIIYYPLIQKGAGAAPKLPGMLVIHAPRRAHRQRRGDIIAFFLSLNNQKHFQTEQIESALNESADCFFQSQGSVTRAMQDACDDLNKKILNHNLEQALNGDTVNGSVSMVVLHHGWLFYGQYGQTTAIQVEMEDYKEFGRGEGKNESLGQSKRIQLRLYQAEHHAGDLVLFVSVPPETWNAYYLSGSAAMPISQVKRRLLNQVTDHLEAVVFKTREGRGITLKGTWDDIPSQEERAPSEVTLDEQKESEGEKTAESSSVQDQLTSDKKEEVQRMSQADEKIQDEQQYSSETMEVIAGETEQPADFDAEQLLRKEREINPILLSLAHTWMNWKTCKARVRQFQERTIRKFFPKANLHKPVSSVFLVFASLAIPLVLILVSVMVYTRIGKLQQFNVYMGKAQKTLQEATIEENPIQQHAAWAKTLELVKLAEEFVVTQESRALNNQVQSKLDEMDLAARLDFRLALTNYFPDGVDVGRILGNSSGVYLLDRTSGSVLRIFLNSKGFFELDSEFKCMPGVYGLGTVTKIVDFVTLPANEDNYKVMALDDQGNLLYCLPGDHPDSRTLVPPASGWGAITATVIDQNVLYVLDAEKDSLWMYIGKDPDRLNVEGANGIVFSENPISFLDENIPDLGGAIDIAINQQDLYILHEDGHMTICQYSPIKEIRLTECQDPAPYTDNRFGRQDKKPWIFMDAKFLMMQQVKLPNGSIFVLNTMDASIYQFSYQLNLERIIKALSSKNYPLPAQLPSGFGITQDSELFLAFKNQLYMAPVN